jgi:hypothetical protein
MQRPGRHPAATDIGTVTGHGRADRGLKLERRRSYAHCLGEPYVCGIVAPDTADGDRSALRNSMWLECRDHDRRRVGRVDDVRNRIAEPEEEVDVRVAAGLCRGRMQVELVYLGRAKRRLLGNHRPRHRQHQDQCRGNQELRSTHVHRATFSISVP